MTSLLVLIDRLLTITDCFWLVCLMVFASTVRFTANMVTNPFWGLWVGLLSG